MPGTLVDANRTMAEKKDEGRERVDLRAPAAWVARVQKQADRRTITISAYIRQAVNAWLEADEANDPEVTGKKKGR